MLDRSDSGGRLETFLAAMLGIAAVATAFTAYQAEIKSGEATTAFNTATLSMTEAGALLNAGFGEKTRDTNFFLEYVKADFQGDHDLARRIRREIMDGNLRAGLREWERVPFEEDPLTPVDAKAYKTETLDDAQTSIKTTEELFAEASEAGEEGDRYTLISVFLAVALFFLGLAGVLRYRRTRLTMMVLGVVVLAFSLVGLVGV